MPLPLVQQATIARLTAEAGVEEQTVQEEDEGATWYMHLYCLDDDSVWHDIALESTHTPAHTHARSILHSQPPPSLLFFTLGEWRKMPSMRI